ncbi:hypothetical protein [Rhodococcus sp. NPDC058521]|uniref:hypothetical protein n=1 Tax=Rhodococcus sp. NPDC058521 TaxID=3346536 RepID=UPI00366353F2
MTAHARPQIGSVSSLLDRHRADPELVPPRTATVSVAFTTSQGAQHKGRSGGYRNEVVSLRVGAATGSCAVEPGSIAPEVVHACAGVPVADLLGHDHTAVRLAALDAWLTHRRPHSEDPRAQTIRIGPGDSLERSLARARHVSRLVESPEGGGVLVIGVVNSLLDQLRLRGLRYVPCDLKGGVTEWGEPVVTDFTAHLDDADAVLASGMMLGNGTFDHLLTLLADTGKQVPVTVFAQTGAAVARELLGRGIHALSAEPYPFFWLTGDETPIHLYRAARDR